MRIVYLHGRMSGPNSQNASFYVKMGTKSMLLG